MTPSKAGYSFAPVSVSTVTLEANLVNQNFVGTSTATYHIGGYVYDNFGIVISGANVVLSGYSAGSALSAADGSYQFANLANSKNYSVTPAKSGYVFSPISISTTSLAANWDNQNFVGTSTATYYIKGYIFNISSAAMSGVIVALSGYTAGSVTSGADGSYQFSNLTNGKNYTITPSQSGINFSPVSITTASLAANWININFTALNQAAYYIKGYSLDPTGAGISNVTLALTGNISQSTTTANNGFYQFLNLHGNSAYAVTPSKTTLSFTPPVINVALLNANMDNENFTGSALYSISGRVADIYKNAVSGVTVALSGSESIAIVTGSDGTYQFSGIPSIGNYTVTPSKTNCGFAPASLNYTNLGGDLVSQNFTSLNRYHIRGTITGSNGSAITKATVMLSGGQSFTAATDENGNYEFDDLNEDGSYSITVNKNGYLFNPATRSTSTLLGIVEDWNFIGTYLSSMSAGEIKILGSLEGKGTINPDRGDTANIYFIATDAGHVELKIYTLNGEQIWEDHKDGLKEGMFEWVPKNIASGTYIAYIKGPGINKRKKIIIIR